MQDFVINIMNQFGYLGTFLLVAIENIFPPIPSEVILAFGGFMTTYSSMHIWGTILAATAGSIVGAIVLYKIGSFLTPARMEKYFSGKPARLLHIKHRDVQKAYHWFTRRGPIAVLLCRCVPIVRSLISIPAGMARMNMPLFILLTTIGSLVWNSILVILGATMGASWETVIKYIDVYVWITIGIIFIVCAVFAIIFFRKRFKKKK
ncbi:MAG: DedA family protein [Clostridia bacterium]